MAKSEPFSPRPEDVRYPEKDESAVTELLETMRAAVDVLREKYPSLNQIVEEPPLAPKRHQWRTADVSHELLENYLNTAEERGWEIFSILPKSLATLSETSDYIIVARRPKGEPHVE